MYISIGLRVDSPLLATTLAAGVESLFVGSAVFGGVRKAVRYRALLDGLKSREKV